MSQGDQPENKGSAKQQVTRRFIITGRVQGVGFRAWARDRATRLRLSGWARNRPDGSVEVVASGRDEDIAALRALLHDGPRYGRVSAVEESSPDASDETEARALGSFHVRY